LSTIDTERIDGVVVARLPYEVDLAIADTVGSDLLAAVANEATGLVIDLSGTRYLDSAGISMLFRTRDRLRDRRQRVGVVCPPGSPLARLLEIVALDSAMPVHTAQPEAIADVARRVISGSG
jgi:anti-anti-sigma factor